MSIGNASFDHHDHSVYRRPDRRRMVSTFVAVVACLALDGRYGGCDDADPDRKPIEIVENSIGMKLASIPAGEFLMGSPATDIDRDGDERQHIVRITRPFRLGVHEVTQGEWTAVMEAAPWKGQLFVNEGDRHPVTYVGWEDATEFCRNLTEKERLAGLLKAGESYRLPTEAEWEYACRAGSETRYHFREDERSIRAYAWYRANSFNFDGNYTREVGLKRMNAWGLFDMHGNVDEWCSDWYGEEYYRESPGADPQGPSLGIRRVIRGGACGDSARNVRSAARGEIEPSNRNFYLGFRVARGSGQDR